MNSVLVGYEELLRLRFRQQLFFKIFKLILEYFRVGSTAQVANVIVDNNKDDEEDDTFLVEEAPPVTQEALNVSNFTCHAFK